MKYHQKLIYGHLATLQTSWVECTDFVNNMPMCTYIFLTVGRLSLGHNAGEAKEQDKLI